MRKERPERLTIKSLARIIRTPAWIRLLRGGYSVKNSAPVAQLDRVPGYEPGGREFESLRARHIF